MLDLLRHRRLGWLSYDYLFVLIGLAFLATHFEPDTLILRGDTGYPLNPLEALSRHLSTWWSSYSSGQPAGHAYSFAFPLLVVIAVLTEVLGRSLAQFALISVFITLSGWATYRLLLRVQGTDKTASLLGGLFYCLSPYVVSEWNVPNLWFFLTYLQLPFMGWAAYVCATRPLIGSCWFIVLSVFFASGYVNSPLFGVVVVTGSCLTLFFARVQGGEWSKAWFHAFCAGASFLIANIWWLGIAFLFFDEGYTQLTTNLDVVGWAHQASRHSQLFHIFQFAFTPSIDGGSFFYTQVLKNAALVWPYILVFLVALWGFLKREDHRGYVTLWVGIICLIFFVKGVSAPLGGVYEFMLRHVPLFSIFKTPPEKFGMLFIFLMAIALGTARLSRPVLWLCLFIVFVGGYPVWTGRLFPDIVASGNKVLKGHQSPPQRYFDVAQEINASDREGRVLLLPAPSNYMTSYVSNGYRGLDWIRSLSEKPVIEAFDTAKDNLGNIIENLSDPARFNYFLSLYNIHWIVLNKDVDPTAYGFVHTEKIEEIAVKLSQNEAIKCDDLQSELVLCHVLGMQQAGGAKQRFPMARIYPSVDWSIYLAPSLRTAKFSRPYFAQLSQEGFRKSFKAGHVHLLDEAGRVRAQLKNLIEMRTRGAKPPVLEFKRQSATRYEVIAYDVEGPFLMVLSEAFHSGWKVYPVVLETDRSGPPANQVHHFSYQNNQLENVALNLSWQREPLPEEQHFKVNGFANAWLINPVQQTKAALKTSLRFLIEFDQQRKLYILLALSACLYLFAVIILIRDRVKNANHR